MPEPEKQEEAMPAEDPAKDLQTERDQLKASLQRVQADFQNFRSRMERERAQWREELLAEAVLPFLDALDNLERGLAAAKDAPEVLSQGVSQVLAQMGKALSGLRVTRIEAEGRPFDPKLHEILCQVPAPEGAQPGQVVSVVAQGWMAGGRLVRPARVTVAGGGQEEAPAAS